MAQWTVFFLLVIGLAGANSWENMASENPFYTAAVFEHNRFGTMNDSAADIIENNLALYKKAAGIASSEGSDLIVFPEYGIFLFNDKSKRIALMETVPDPRYTIVNPCNDEDQYTDRHILRTLSCMAKENNIFVVANMGDTQKCEGDPKCPEDGSYHFNTNVVFNRNGSLILKYHKEHLFFEKDMDLPQQPQVPVFQTDFGTFATYISFDLMYSRMGEIAEKESVDAVILPTQWVELTPQLSSIQLFQSWAIGNNRTLIATNLQIPGYYAVGSGIFHGQDGALAYSYNPDGIGKLVIARVPKKGYSASTVKFSKIISVKEDNAWHWKHDGLHVNSECSRQILNDTDQIHKDYRCVEENISNYTFVKLNHTSDHVEVCENGMCCSLDYTAKKMAENYYLAIYNGTHNLFNRYFLAEENCLLVRCEPLGNNPCATFPRKSKTRFHQVRLQATFSTKFVYPSFLGSRMRLIPKQEWKYELNHYDQYQAEINFKSLKGRQLIAVGFKGRCYERDVPYIR